MLAVTPRDGSSRGSRGIRIATRRTRLPKQREKMGAPIPCPTSLTNAE